MKIGLLTMDSVGFLKDPALVADRIMRNFFVANYTQTNHHYGEISSLPWLISAYAENLTGLHGAIKERLTLMLESYFEDTNVEVRIQPPKDSPEGFIHEIIIDAAVSKDGVRYSVGKLIEICNNKISAIYDYESGVII